MSADSVQRKQQILQRKEQTTKIKQKYLRHLLCKAAFVTVKVSILRVRADCVGDWFAGCIVKICLRSIKQRKAQRNIHAKG
eukprot:SAG31_NODE_529_length_14420_cov_20.000140_5_plen_81_part_00